MLAPLSPDLRVSGPQPSARTGLRSNAHGRALVFQPAPGLGLLAEPAPSLPTRTPSSAPSSPTSRPPAPESVLFTPRRRSRPPHVRHPARFRRVSMAAEFGAPLCTQIPALVRTIIHDPDAAATSQRTQAATGSRTPPTPAFSFRRRRHLTRPSTRLQIRTGARRARCSRSRLVVSDHGDDADAHGDRKNDLHNIIPASLFVGRLLHSPRTAPACALILRILPCSVDAGAGPPRVARPSNTAPVQVAAALDYTHPKLRPRPTPRVAPAHPTHEGSVKLRRRADVRERWLARERSERRRVRRHTRRRA
jgi:hypothetical protein